MMENKPLVSIVVISYNSSSTIIETLDSIADQTYSRLELIVSDDASKDNTVNIAKEWIERNKNRFENSIVITTEVNTGTSANVNRGIRASKAKWIKTIAADDLLLPTCIEMYIDYINVNPDIKLCYSFGKIFKTADSINKEEDVFPNSTELDFYSKTAEQQFEDLLIGYKVFTIGLFVNRRVTDIVPFDERYKYLEDYPFVFHCSQRGIHIDFMPKLTCKYRIATGSVMHQETLFPNRLMEMNCLFFYNEIKPLLEQRNMQCVIKANQRTLLLWSIAVYVFNNKKNWFTTSCIYFISFILKIFLKH